MKLVLCVRTQPEDVPQSVKDQLEAAFGSRIVYQYVNPATPEELEALASNGDVVAVYLHERPLPANLIASQAIPCVSLNGAGELVRVVAVTAWTVPISTPPLPTLDDLAAQAKRFFDGHESTEGLGGESGQFKAPLDLIEVTEATFEKLVRPLPEAVRLVLAQLLFAEVVRRDLPVPEIQGDDWLEMLLFTVMEAFTAHLYEADPDMVVESERRRKARR